MLSEKLSTHSGDDRAAAQLGKLLRIQAKCHQHLVCVRAQRWRALAASDRRVLFIREHFWTGQPVRQADLLHDALRRAAPRLCFRLLYLTRPDVHPLPPDRPDLLHRPLAPPDPPDWRGDNAAWQALFDTCLALPPPPGPAAA